MVERFNRNIRIGLVILGAYLIYVLFDYLFLSAFLSEMIIHKSVEYPKWLEPVDVFSTVLIMTTYLFFVIRYLKIKRSFSIDHHLKDLLAGILETIKTYRRMFYLAVIILLINIVLSFSAGLYLGIKSNTVNFPNGFENLSGAKIFGIVGVGLAFLIPLVLLTFFVLHWGFNKLYGRYLQNIEQTIQELDEPESQESEL